MALTLAQICSALYTHQELKNLGLSNNLISAQHRRGQLIRLTRGIYLDGTVGRQCKPEERAKALTLALARTRPTAVISHQSAALLWGAPLLTLPTKVHLSLPGANKNGHRQTILHSRRPNLAIYQGGLEMPRQQYQIRTPSGRTYRADFAWPHLKILLEVDGLHKYYGAYRPTRDQLRYDNLRQRELELAGWRVIRATWEDLSQRPGLLMGRLRGLGVGLRKMAP